MSDPRRDRDPLTDPAVDPAELPITTNPLGGRAITPPPIVEVDTPDQDPEARETADPVKRKASELPPGVDYTEPTVTNEATGEELISEVQKQTGVGGGIERVPPGTIAVGGTLAVDDSHPELRSEPGAEAGETAGHLTKGTVLLLMGGPQQVGDQAWWHVRAPDGRTGWVAESVLQPHTS